MGFMNPLPSQNSTYNELKSISKQEITYNKND